jgi:hypothetical protein
MKRIFCLLAFLLLQNSLFAAEETKYDIKEVTYNIVLKDDTETTIICKVSEEDRDKILSEICKNKYSEYAKINYSELKKYFKSGKYELVSVFSESRLVNFLGELNNTIYFDIEIVKYPKRFLFWKEKPVKHYFKILNNIQGSTITVKFYKEDKKTLLTEEFKILEYRASHDYKIYPIIELDKPIEILGYKVINTYDIDEERECIMNNIYYKKHNRTVEEKCESIPSKNISVLERIKIQEKEIFHLKMRDKGNK